MGSWTAPGSNSCSVPRNHFCQGWGTIRDVRNPGCMLRQMHYPLFYRSGPNSCHFDWILSLISHQRKKNPFFVVVLKPYPQGSKITSGRLTGCQILNLEYWTWGSCVQGKHPTYPLCYYYTLKINTFERARRLAIHQVILVDQADVFERNEIVKAPRRSLHFEPAILPL